MEFQEVDHLVPGKKYKVVHYLHEYIATYKSSSIYNNPLILTFSTKEKDYHHYIFSDYTPYKYYVPIFQRQRIQEAMEQRTLQRILQTIIGDPTFTWVGASPLQPR